MSEIRLKASQKLTTNLLVKFHMSWTKNYITDYSQKILKLLHLVAFIMLPRIQKKITPSPLLFFLLFQVYILFKNFTFDDGGDDAFDHTTPYPYPFPCLCHDTLANQDYQNYTGPHKSTN